MSHRPTLHANRVRVLKAGLDAESAFVIDFEWSGERVEMRHKLVSVKAFAPHPDVLEIVERHQQRIRRFDTLLIKELFNDHRE